MMRQERKQERFETMGHGEAEPVCRLGNGVEEAEVAGSEEWEAKSWETRIRRNKRR